ncbi:DNA repair protein [Yarrowia sp. B02]|nr:DNA repair protein [Yarrowia sp. B02]
MSSLFILSDDEEDGYDGNDAQVQDADVDALFVEDEQASSISTTVPRPAETPATIPAAPERRLQREIDDDEESEQPLFISRPTETIETSTNADIKPVSTNLPYAFQRTIVRELLKEDALLILGRGLGIDLIAANLIHSLDLAGNSVTVEGEEDPKNSLVLVLGASDEDNERLEQDIAQLTALDGFYDCPKDAEEDELGADPLKEVASADPRPSRLQFITNETGIASERTRMYRAGGVFSITSRVLIVDMLRGYIDVPQISAVVILNAHRATEASLEAFILRVMKQDNPWATIKALSDQPERFIRGFSPLTQMQKNLFVKKTRLWPRFHLKVKECLNGVPGKKQNRGVPTVVELQCQLTPKMQQIQTSILELIGLCIADIKRKVTSVDMEDWKVENLLDQSSSSAFFDDLVQRQLNPIWHRIPPETRKMVGDISSLKGLLQDLLTEDCISFFRQLELMRLSKGPETPWLVTEDASNLFDAAKARVHERADPKDPKSIKKVNEELPKWRELAILVDEHLSSGREGPLLIMCSSSRIKTQLRKYMCSLRDDRRQGKGQWTSNYLSRKFKRYQMWREGYFQMKRRLKEAKEASKDDQNAESAPQVHHANKRRRVRGGGSVSTGTHKVDEQAELIEIEKLNNLVEDEEEEVQDLDEIVLSDDEDEINYGSFKFDEMTLLDTVVIETFDAVLDLNELGPSGIIMYQPNPEFFRTIEIYGRDRKVAPNVYLLYYGLSYEEQAFLAAVRKEKDAFSKLIKERAKMPMLLATTEDDQRGLKIIREANSRIAGGQISTNSYGRILVDVREFRAALPSILHSYGFQVYPTHLTVGDYVLSPHMVVERKSIPDLIKSFQDGRLLTQCEAMFRYYSYVVILIEFEVGGFTFDPASDTPGAASANMATLRQASELRGKLSLLLLTFPKLKIIWSSSPRETARIFDELRGNNNKNPNKPPWAGEPDPDIAAAYGTSGVGDSTTGQQNHMAIDMLRDIPGVTAKNFPLIIAKVNSLYDLCKLTVEELAEIVGSEPAREIMGFLEQEL